MAILSSRVIWPSTWPTRVAIGAAECTQGQSAAPVLAVAAPVAAPAPTTASAEQARVSTVTAAIRALLRFLAGNMVAL
jgi:hypothetical protein